ncbi:MAG: tetratricopeptide repeat protein [Methanofastidiosum sp.]
MIKTCPFCDSTLLPGGKICPKCGKHISQVQDPENINKLSVETQHLKPKTIIGKKKISYIATFILALILISIVFYSVLPTYFFITGENLYNKGKYENAISYFDRALDINQDYSEAWTYRGYSYLELDKYSSANYSFNKVLEKDAYNREAIMGEWVSKGWIERWNMNFDAASACFDEAIKVSPDNPYAWYQKGSFLQNTGIGGSIEYFNKAIEIDPNYKQAWYNKGFELSLSNPKEALSCLEKALKLDPYYTEAWYRKGSVLMKENRISEATISFDKAISLDPYNTYQIVQVGSNYFFKQMYSEALRYYEMAITIDPDYAYPWLLKGDVYYEQKDYEKSLECYEKAILIKSDFINAWEGKAKVYKTIGNDSEYKYCIEKIKSINPEYMN